MNSNQKIALVTGAGSGIGKQTAFALLKAGYAVALAGRRIETLKVTAETAGVDASRILVVPTDVTDPASIKATFAKVKKTFGRLDVLFNNAGIGAPDVNLEDLTYEQWKRVVDTNLIGSFLCTQEAFKIMKIKNPGGDGLSTTLPYRHKYHESIPRHIQQPNMELPGSQNQHLSMDGSTILPALR